MATLVPSQTGSGGRLPDPRLVVIILLLVLVLPNPAGYVGAGGDDFFYVQAARCVAAHGWCVPDTHWAARWPIVAPMGAVFAVLGDGRWQASVVPFAYSVMAVLLLVRVIGEAWGRAAALLGGIAFVVTAAFAKGLLQPNVETAEVAWMIAAAWAGHRALTGPKSTLFAVLTGLFLGLAIQSRMTSLAWLPILGLGLIVFPGNHRRLILPALAGLAIPIAFDMLVNWRIAGDPLLSQHLSILHTRIASSELPPCVDRSRSPLFNPQFIGGWAPAVCIHTHWTVQGIVNLLLNPVIGPTLLGAILLLFMARKQLGWRSPETLLAGAAVLYTGVLIYALAIDPKARMFLPVAAIAAMIIGRLGVVLWGSGEKVLVGTMIAGIAVVGAWETGKRFDMTVAGTMAGQWAREHPGGVSVEKDSWHTLTFDPTVRALPVWPIEYRPRTLVLVAGPCAASEVARSGMTLARSHDFGRPNNPFNLCEFSFSDRAGPQRP